MFIHTFCLYMGGVERVKYIMHACFTYTARVHAMDSSAD